MPHNKKVINNASSLMALNIKPRKDGIQFPVNVQTRSSKNKICGLHGESLKIRLTSLPVDGEANKMCIKLLAKMLSVSPMRIFIVSGHKVRNKIIRIEGIKTTEFLDKVTQFTEGAA